MSGSSRLLACCVALLVGCASTPPPKHRPAPPPRAAAPAPAPDLSAYRLGIADKVRVDVFNEPDLTVEVFVDGTGNISYPLLGAVPARSKTAAELQKAIRDGLAAGYLKDPDVRVTVAQYRPFYAIGQVRKPGPYPYVIGL